MKRRSRAMPLVTDEEARQAGLLLWEAEVAMREYLRSHCPPVQFPPIERPTDKELMRRGLDALRRAAGLPTLSDLERRARDRANRFVSELAAKREIPPVERIAS